MSISFLLVARQKKRNRRKKRKHANVPCISLTLNAKMLFELSAQILSGLTIALRARSPDTILPDVIARSNATKQSIDRATSARWHILAHYISHMSSRKTKGLSAISFPGLLRYRSQWQEPSFWGRSPKNLPEFYGDPSPSHKTILNRFVRKSGSGWHEALSTFQPFNFPHPSPFTLHFSDPSPDTSCHPLPQGERELFYVKNLTSYRPIVFEPS